MSLLEKLGQNIQAKAGKAMLEGYIRKMAPDIVKIMQKLECDFTLIDLKSKKVTSGLWDKQEVKNEIDTGDFKNSDEKISGIMGQVKDMILSGEIKSSDFVESFLIRIFESEDKVEILVSAQLLGNPSFKFKISEICAEK